LEASVENSLPPQLIETSPRPPFSQDLILATFTAANKFAKLFERRLDTSHLHSVTSHGPFDVHAPPAPIRSWPWVSNRWRSLKNIRLPSCMPEARLARQKRSDHFRRGVIYASTIAITPTAPLDGKLIQRANDAWSFHRKGAPRGSPAFERYQYDLYELAARVLGMFDRALLGSAQRRAMARFRFCDIRGLVSQRKHQTHEIETHRFTA